MHKYSDTVPNVAVVKLYRPMNANRLLKENVQALLRRDHLEHKDLAQWCHRKPSWISKVFAEDRRTFPNKYFDRIADLFGLETYQLFQPGIAGVDRRGLERRTRSERRQSFAQKLHGSLRAEVDSIRQPAKRGVDVPPELRRLTEDYERKAAALFSRAIAGGQAPIPRAARARVTRHHRAPRGPDDPKTKKP